MDQPSADPAPAQPSHVAHIYRYPGATDAEAYEWENQIADPEARIEAFMASVHPLAGATVIDIGAGSAFHAVRFAPQAARVFAVEPDPDMLHQAFTRLAHDPCANVSVIAADAEHIPLQDAVADIIHSRFAYFFGPESGGVQSCLPGVHEARRLLRPGGVFFVIDNSLTSGKFAEFLRRYGYVRSETGEAEQAERDAFWRDLGFQKHTVESWWNTRDPWMVRRVINMEFPRDPDATMAEITGPQLSYHYDIYWWTEPQQ